jgi:hypothetical protein
VRLYTWRRTALADEVRRHTGRGGGEGGNGAAKPDGVIHRYVFNHTVPARPIPKDTTHTQDIDTLLTDCAASSINSHHLYALVSKHQRAP